MPAYVIYQGEVTDPDRYDKYRAKAGESVAASPGHFIVRGGEVVSLEGDPPPGRTVVLEFPTRQAALDWYHGAAYSEARAMRANAAVARMYVVDGVEAPPPT